jgi:hypothetical protein
VAQGAILYSLELRKICFPCWKWVDHTCHPAFSIVTMLTTLSKTPHANKHNYTEWKPFNPSHNSISGLFENYTWCTTTLYSYFLWSIYCIQVVHVLHQDPKYSKISLMFGVNNDRKYWIKVSMQLVTVHNCYKRSPFLWTSTILTDSSHCCDNYSK